MTSSTHTKSSSRAGRFKKKLVTEEALLLEAPLILKKLELFDSSYLSQSDFTACYLLLFLSHRFPGSWLGSKRDDKQIPGKSWKELPFDFEPNVKRRLEEVESLSEIFSNFSLKSTPLTVNRAITEWSLGNYDLELMFRIPSPQDVLRQQKSGRRCVTTITDKRIAKYILGDRDALSFTMHDLIHADHFYFHNECYLGQLGFYGLLNKTITYFDLSNEKFASEFEYVISDMNAYAIHLMKCLKSAMIHHFDQLYFESWLTDLKSPDALMLLNTPHYIPESMDSLILSWLDQFREC
jgi:hypothetical protein